MSAVHPDTPPPELRQATLAEEALDALVAERDAATTALRGLADAAAQYLDTGRGDIDGWIVEAREALARIGAET